MALLSNQQRELVRLLYLEHGHKKASEISGVEYDLVRQWAHRGNWTPARNQNVSQSVTKTIVDNVQSQLANHAEQTKLGLSAYARRQAEHLASEGKLSDHGAFRNVVAGASQLHGWQADTKPTHFTLNQLNINTLAIDSLDTPEQ